MSHNTVFGGASREIEGGTPLIGGVAREIESGLVLVGGVAREIEFGPNNAIINLISDNTQTGIPNNHACGIVIDGTTYFVKYKETQTIEVPIGTEISFWFSTIQTATNNTLENGIYLNGVKIYTVSNAGQYVYTVNGNVQINTKTYLYQYNSAYYRYIKITEL